MRSWPRHHYRFGVAERAVRPACALPATKEPSDVHSGLVPESSGAADYGKQRPAGPMTRPAIRRRVIGRWPSEGRHTLDRYGRVEEIAAMVAFVPVLIPPTLPVRILPSMSE